MKLGSFVMDRPVFLAPMAGVTDKAFRETVRSLGGEYVWTEMISDKALSFRNPRTVRMLDPEGEASPRIVQLFGAEAHSMAKAAEICQHYGADVIDINMGCPTLKIVKNGEGSALLRDIERAQKIASAVVRAVDLPVTVKMRLGWDETEIVVKELGRRLEAVGVSMLTLHARTREEFYSGRANWQWIKELKESVGIPVIGNGDISRPEDARRMLEETGCDGVMIGRGALGNPWLPFRAQHFVRTGRLTGEPSWHNRSEVASAHFERLLRYKGEKIGLKEMRKHAAWYVKGFRQAAQLREKIMQVKEPDGMLEILKGLGNYQGDYQGDYQA
ncbi:tRNA-dihydrouridine synthase C [Peptococcaceae bacterium CEB3]|nr:tRNA-dihydrouridine synthase C [Peptococcaceae bacterium CEB3]